MRLPETDEIAAELYLVPPARFVEAREQLVRQARATGHRDLARELHALRRPTLSAWLVNMLARRQRERMQQLYALGRELRQAQTRLEAEQLRRLPAHQQELITELLEAAGRHAAEVGVRPTEATLSEVAATLQAGLVDLGAAAAVLSGQLARPMSHAGFGPLPQVEVVGHPPDPLPAPNPDPSPERFPEWRMWPVDDELRRRRERSDTAPADRPDGRRTSTATAVAAPGGPEAPDEPVRPRVHPAARSAEALRRAETALADAASAHWQSEHDLAEAEAAMQEVNDRLETLDQQRMQVRREKVAAEQDLDTARAAQRAALRAMTRARRALETAENQLQAPVDRPSPPDSPP